MTALNSALVTGGAGYIGSHMVLALRDAGWSVVVVDDLSSGRRQAIPDGVPFVKGNVGDPALIASALAQHRPAAVLHFAGSIVVPESVSDPLKYYGNNTSASRTLIAACVDAGVSSFVFSSTAAVYGQPDRVPISEDTPLAPINPYGTSKLCTEWILRDASAATRLRHVALRYFNVAGADPQRRTGQTTRNSTHLIKVACETAVGKRAFLEIFGDDYPTADGTCIRDYIHVSDLVNAHLVALRYLQSGGESQVFNCGYGHGYSVRDVVDMVRLVAGGHLDARMAPRRAGDPPQLVADTRRIRETLGWKPRYDDLRFIVESALGWERHLMSLAA
jgi:UDP-glucose 4-epimerase